MALNACKNFAVLLCFYVNSYIHSFILIFLRWQEGGSYSPPSHPPKFAIVRNLVLNIKHSASRECMVPRLCNFPSIYGNLVGALFNGLLAELFADLDSFFHQYHKQLDRSV